jgi:hypothetical protein
MTRLFYWQDGNRFVRAFPTLDRALEWIDDNYRRAHFSSHELVTYQALVDGQDTYAWEGIQQLLRDRQALLRDEHGREKYLLRDGELWQMVYPDDPPSTCQP